MEEFFCINLEVLGSVPIYFVEEKTYTDLVDIDSRLIMNNPVVVADDNFRNNS